MVLVNFGASTDTTGLGYNPISAFTNSATGLKYTDGSLSGYQLTYQDLGGKNTANSSSISYSSNIQTSWENLTGHAVPDPVRTTVLGFGINGATCSLTGLQAGKEYTFFALSGRGGNGGGNITITFDGVESYSSFSHFSASNDKTPSLNLSNGTLTTGNIAPGSGTGNYTELTFVADDSGTFSFTYKGTALGYNISGFGLKENFTIPEPATAGLGILTLALLGFRRKR